MKAKGRRDIRYEYGSVWQRSGNGGHRLSISMLTGNGDDGGSRMRGKQMVLDGG